MAAVEDACGFSGDNSEVVLDLFCGVGTLGLCVASRAKHVYGWEVVPEAVRDARRNAADNDIANATFRRGDLARLRASLGGGARDLPGLSGGRGAKKGKNKNNKKNNDAGGGGTAGSGMGRGAFRR